MAHRLLLVLAVIALVLPLFGKDPDWRTGKLIDIKAVPISRTFGTGGLVKTVHRHIWTFTVEGDDLIYDAEGRDGDFGLIVNDPVTFAADKDTLYLKDTKGKKKELFLVKKTRKDPVPACQSQKEPPPLP